MDRPRVTSNIVAFMTTRLGSLLLTASFPLRPSFLCSCPCLYLCDCLFSPCLFLFHFLFLSLYLASLFAPHCSAHKTSMNGQRECPSASSCESSACPCVFMGVWTVAEQPGSWRRPSRDEMLQLVNQQTSPISTSHKSRRS